MTAPSVTPGPDGLKALSDARIALGRSGVSLPTTASLQFAMDHALARDAVHAPADFPSLSERLNALGLSTQAVCSAAPDRGAYLVRPDLGRQLSAADRDLLLGLNTPPCDLAVVLADGLSARALSHAPILLEALLPRLSARGWKMGPAVLASQARVALGDEIGEALKARMVLVLIGERPGLSSPDSMGAYLTLGPRRGRSDAERNCVSNIRPAGLPPADAAHKLDWLMAEARRLGLTGVALKDESDLGVVSKKVVHTLPWCEAGDAGVRPVEIVGLGPGFDGLGSLG